MAIEFLCRKCGIGRQWHHSESNKPNQDEKNSFHINDKKCEIAEEWQKYSDTVMQTHVSYTDWHPSTHKAQEHKMQFYHHVTLF